jgi:hypothetical protein
MAPNHLASRTCWLCNRLLIDETEFDSLARYVINLKCDTLRITGINNDIHGNGIITLAVTVEGVTVEMMVSFDEVEKMQFEFQAPVSPLPSKQKKG